jgi:DDE superfamily endonuclease
VVLDNASTHVSDDTETWLANQQGRVVFHVTPTGASWLNQIEIWNGILTRKVIRRGTFSSTKILTRAIATLPVRDHMVLFVPACCMPSVSGGVPAPAPGALSPFRQAALVLRSLFDSTRVAPLAVDDGIRPPDRV